jgi:hypothetical protein
MILEFYGTSLGNWAWAPVSPILGLPTGNPPAAIGVGYCIMDGLARLLAPRVEHAAQKVLPRLRLPRSRFLVARTGS